MTSRIFYLSKVNLGLKEGKKNVDLHYDPPFDPKFTLTILEDSLGYVRTTSGAKLEILAQKLEGALFLV